VVRMFIMVISIFAVCWLPYHGYFIYVYHHNSLAVSSYVPHLYLSFYWLAMSNAMVNPIIYYWMNNR
jgi:tachykinin-like receptor